MKKTILITGAFSGFGKAAAIELFERGHTVYATTRTKVQAKDLKSELTKREISIDVFKLDVTDSTDYKKIDDLNIDVLINNAGTGESGSLAEIDLNLVRSNFETNLFGPLELTQRVLKQMLKRDSGKIIFISSLAGRVTIPFLGAYSMTKFSVSSGAEALRKELGRITKNVHVSVVEPGAYCTGFNERIRGKMYSWMKSKTYFGSIVDQLKKEDEFFHKYLEKKNIKSIVNQIIKTAEDSKPRLRYSAPFSQSLAVQIQRILGK